MSEKEPEIGDQVTLNRPERGYRNGEIIGLDGLRWIIRLPSGLETSMYDDEFEVD